MCGIFGVVGANEPEVRSAITIGSAKLIHRGPDDAGATFSRFGEATLGLGHRRLSILDLSPAGHQPMLHRATGCQIVFNGEIYNYRRLRIDLERAGEMFHSGTDTEVLLCGLSRFGAKYLERIEGMFAFGFFDPRGPSLLLARDPAGIKPLYVAETNDTLVFSSEVRAILASRLVEPRIDRLAVAGYLAYGGVQSPSTLFQRIGSLQPGSTLEFRPKEGAVYERNGLPRPFWRFPETNSQISSAAAIPLLREALTAAVEDHLVADVPVGLFLSSGLDSTILAGLAARKVSTIRSFTVCVDDHPGINDRKLAAETSTLFGLKQCVIPLPKSVALDSFEAWLAALDQPSMDGFNVYLISRAVREQGIKVAISGLGADELFGGYPSFRDVPRLRSMFAAVRFLPRRFRQELGRIATIGRSESVQRKLTDLLTCDGSVRSLYFHRRRAMSNSQLRELGVCPNELGLAPNAIAPESLWDIDCDNTDLTRLISQLEFRCYQGNILLRDADANGMAFGLEIRVPFIDKRVIDLAHSLPGAVRFPNHCHPKHLLRVAFKDLLRPQLLNQRKRGFVLPIGQWLAGCLRPLCEIALDSLKRSGVVRPEGVDAVWNSFLAAPDSPAWSRALSLLVLGDFLRRNAAVP